MKQQIYNYYFIFRLKTGAKELPRFMQTDSDSDEDVESPAQKGMTTCDF